MDLFATYEKEYKTLYETISKKVVALKTSGKGFKLLQNEIQRELEEADEILGQLEMELVSLPPQLRNQNTVTLRSYKEALKKLKKDMNSAALSERDQLLGTNSVAVDMPSNNRSRLLQGTERLENASRRLEDANRMALETEQIGISTLGDLHRQRNQIERTRDGLGEADSWIAKSQGLLKSMQRKYNFDNSRLAANKLLMWGIITLLVLLILAVIVAKVSG